MNRLLEVRSLSVDYRDAAVGRTVRTVDNIDIAVNAGEVLGIVGRSGSGKSILAKGLLNAVPPPGMIAGGSVRVNGKEMIGASEQALRSMRGDAISIIVQNARAHLNPLVSIGRQLVNIQRSHRTASRKEAKERAIDVLQAVGIPAARERFAAYPHELSGGMAQRALVAMAMICEPDVLIADEPTSGLDVTIQDQVLRLIRAGIHERGAAGILISRDMGIVANYCDRVATIVDGAIVESASVADFFSQAEHPVSRALIAAASYETAPTVA